ncbi:hypothetical protein EPR50_G00097220 [Perca flavescens]|uniref:MICOS complex subunit MIC13 n=1 Tax=Perca flavescens TaxID=8167 RepID=A0A484CZF5_PERFV|nr:MICOS complex subunit MIC13 [Perca flavescens]TDH08344.1 hypothetical protein EPR50_G00097220 [Perca flavescens]
MRRDQTGLSFSRAIQIAFTQAYSWRTWNNSTLKETTLQWTMAARILPVVKLATKLTIAGGALYVACDSGLLGSSEQGSEALEKAKAAIPPAIEEWMKYFGLEAQLPTMPKVEFSPVQAWNSGVRQTISTLSEAPTKATGYTNQCLQYLKDLTK